MTTTQRLWLGFGFLIFLQVASVSGTGLWLRSLQADLAVITEKVEPLSAAAYEMEINMVSVGMATLRYLQTAEPEARQRAIDAAAAFESFNMTFKRLETSGRYRAEAARNDVLFDEYRALSIRLIEQKDIQLVADPADLQRFVELRRLMGDILNTGIQQLVQRQITTAESQANRTLEVMSLAVIGFLLCVPLLSIWISVGVGRGIVRAEQTLGVTLDSIGDGVVTTDIDGRIVRLNPVAENLTGWSDKDARGQPLDAVFRIVNETTRRPEVSPVPRVLKEGVASNLTNHSVLIAKDGSERAIDDSAAPIRDAQGQVSGCVLIFRDVSAQRHTAQQLEENQQRFRALFESGPVAVFSCDRNGILLDYNQRAAELWGREPERNNPGERYFASLKLYRPDGGPLTPLENPLVEALRTGSAVRDAEVLMERPDGSHITVIVNFSPLIGDSGEVTGGISAFYDVTERKRLEDVLRQSAADLSEADHRKNEFLALLAHELRNPLATISNAAQILMTAKASPEAYRSTTKMMERQIGHMARLVDDLLDVSRISRGKIELRKDQVELLAIIKHAVDAVRPEYVAKGIELAVTQPPMPVYVDGDATRLQQVLGNLLNNARKFTSFGGRVWLIIELQNKEVVIRVQDNGIGIAADQLPHIFGLFVQSDTALNRTSDGLGIGLALVKALVEMHGGSVSARSDGPGRGSEFTLRLPVLIKKRPGLATTLPEPPQKPAAPAQANKISRRILVVDDNRASAQSLALLLKLGNHEVQCAHDGQEAVDMAKSVNPEVILLDIGLPKLNGYEVAQKIRAEEWGRDIVLIALTGWGQKSDKRRAGESGFNHYMVKPVKHGDLTELLAGLPVPKA